jgi:hypothetical protein
MLFDQHNKTSVAGAGAARSRIIWSEPDLQRHAAPAPAPAPTAPVGQMVLKMTQNKTIYNPFSSYFQQDKSYRIKLKR